MTVILNSEKNPKKFFHISYDLSMSKKNYQTLHNGIKSFKDWVHCQRSTWLIGSNLSAKQVHERLKKYIGDSDCLLVMEVNLDKAFGWMPKLEEAAKWTISVAGGCFTDPDFLSDFDG